MTDYAISRDFRNRPWVTQNGEPLEGIWKSNASKRWFAATNAEPYGRMSGLADALDDKSGLVDWAAAAAAIGVARNPGILASVAALASAHSDPWNTPEAKAPLKELVWRAKSAGGSDQSADLGTAFHQFTELVDFGRSPEFLPPVFAPLIAEYQRATAGLIMESAELFVVNDELKRAGSFDRVVRCPEGLVVDVPGLKEPVDLSGQAVVADVKSGKSDSAFPLKVTVQIAGYANGVLYDQASGDRKPIAENLSTQVGFLIHQPIRTAGAKCQVYPLNLVKGLELARLAEHVRAVTKMDKLKPIDVSA